MAAVLRTTINASNHLKVIFIATCSCVLADFAGEAAAIYYAETIDEAKINLANVSRVQAGVSLSRVKMAKKLEILNSTKSPNLSDREISQTNFKVVV